jgi:hypothetical protein
MIHIMPYTVIDGIPSMKDSLVMSFYDQMVKDGTADLVFCDGKINDRKQFLANIKSNQTIFIIAILEGDPVGLAWINRIEKKKAWGHFCLFSNGWGDRSVDIGKAMVRFLIGMKSDDYLFDVFFGLFPTENKLALSFVKRCGGKIVGEIPKSLWNAKKNKSESGTLIYYERET